MKKITAIAIAMMALSSLPFIGQSKEQSQDETKESVTAQVKEVEEEEISDFEKAVQIIKKYETLHQPKHWPLVGYGHKVLPGEKFSRSRALSEAEADALLRKDLKKNCALFREYGADSLLLGTLAYNIGSGAAKRSSVATKLKNGDRDIRSSYLAHSRYRGKTHSQILKRRTEEFDALFRSDSKTMTPEDGGPLAAAENILSYLSKL